MRRKVKVQEENYITKEQLSGMLQCTVPIVKEEYIALPEGVTRKLCYCSNMNGSETFAGGYVEAVREFQRDEKKSGEKVLIVSDEKGIIRKAAALLAAEVEESDGSWDDEDEYDEYFDLDDEEDVPPDPETSFAEVNFSDCIKTERADINPYHIQIITMPVPDSFLFYGLEEPAGREKKLESIICCKARRKMVAVPVSQADSLWARKLIREQGYSVLRLPSSEEHFKKIASAYKGTSAGLAGTDTLETFSVSLAESEEKGEKISKSRLEKLISKAKRDCGVWMTEEDILWYLANRAWFTGKERSALETLGKMTGLAGAKTIAEELQALEYEKKSNPLLKQVRNHMVFYGNPGTGKTTVARLIAEIFAETDQSGEVFVVADRSSLIGRYVGHTAPKIAAKFKEARGGVLFVDEAGFFLNKDSGGYVAEAIREFVRYMEEYEDVTVIFALYASELEEFLALDPGLSSRIGRCVAFEDYSEEELLEIAGQMFTERGYQMSGRVKPLIKEYLRKRKKTAGEGYGNAREVRKLVESTIIRHAVRKRSETKRMKKNAISTADVQEGILRLEKERKEKKNAFGFRQAKEKNLLQGKQETEKLAI